MPNIDLSIVIVNYNTLALTTQCINSIVAETINISYELIVVDNASTDNSSTELPTLFPTIQLIKNTTNVGFGIANNMGMEKAKGAYLLLLNSDTIIIEKGIEKAYHFIKKNQHIDVLTCKQINEHGDSIIPAEFYFKTNSIFNYIKHHPIQQLLASKLKKNYFNELTKNGPVKNVSGAFMLLKKEVFTSTKGFDPDFFIYYEETEWCKRINKNYQLYYLHDVSFIHLHGKSASRLVMQKQMHLSGGLFWYKSGILHYLLFLIITYLIYVPEWLLLSIFSLKSTTRKHFFKYLNIYYHLLPEFLFNIPANKNNYAGRTISLKLKEL